MAGRQFRIERSDLIRGLGGGNQTFSTAGGKAEKLVAQWLDERGEPIKQARFAQVVPPPLEWPGDVGLIEAQVREPMVVSRSAPPTNAYAIEFRRGDNVATFAARSSVEPWRTERMTVPFGGTDEQFEIRIFSELFTDFHRFEAKVAEFHDALAELEPFARIAREGRLRLIGHFARSTGPGGHFRTVPQGQPGERRIFGDRAHAQERLTPVLNRMPALILIESDLAGGAGGVLSSGRRHYPAWASLGSMSGQATWQAVAIHELAHGFGLSDEYIDSRMEGQPLPAKYANVSNARRARDLSWNTLAGLPGETPLPTHSDQGVPTGGVAAGRPVAAYRGAYYSDRDWRPSLGCRMRDYVSDGFCPVCSQIILRMFGMS